MAGEMKIAELIADIKQGDMMSSSAGTSGLAIRCGATSTVCTAATLREAAGDAAGLR